MTNFDPLVGGILVFFGMTVVLVLWMLWRLRRRKGFEPKELQYIKSHWIRIIDMFSGNPKGAILDADKLLDYALGKKGFEGHLGEKLKRAGGRFSDQNAVWSAHKLRNRIAHELDEIPMGEAKSALKNFKRALNDLGAKL